MERSDGGQVEDALMKTMDLARLGSRDPRKGMRLEMQAGLGQKSMRTAVNIVRAARDAGKHVESVFDRVRTVLSSDHDRSIAFVSKITRRNRRTRLVSRAGSVVRIVVITSLLPVGVKTTHFTRLHRLSLAS